MGALGTGTAQGKTRGRVCVDILALAASLALLAGLLEGAGLLLLQHLEALNWDMAQMGVAWEILYVSPAVNLLLFVLVAGGPLAALRWSGERLALRAAVFLFTLLLVFDLVNLSGHLRDSSALIFAAGAAAVFTRAFARRPERVLKAARQAAPLLAGLALLAFAVVEGGYRLAEWRAERALPVAPAGAPNVMVVVLDTVRADHLTLAGYSRSTSPHLDRIVRLGTYFENAIASSSWTLPSHVSMLSGRAPHEHGAEGAAYDGRYPMLQEMLRSMGYRTAAFSGNPYYFSRHTGFGPGFQHFEDFFGSLEDCLARTFFGRKFFHYATPRLGLKDIPGRKAAKTVNKEVLGWIDAADASRPFFVFINFFDAHDPYLPPEPFRGRFCPNPKLCGRLNFLARRLVLRNPAEIDAEMGAYDGAIASLDDQVGKLHSALESRGLLRNTLLIIVSDHGEAFGEHNLFLHRNSLYLETLHVPLLFVWPARIPAGARVATPVSINSIAPTVLDLLGRPEPEKFSSLSLKPFLLPDAPRPQEWHPPDSLLAECRFELLKQTPCYEGRMASVVNRKWHLIWNEGRPEELYEWSADRAEQQNKIANPEGARQAQTLLEVLRSRGIINAEARMARADAPR
jgi:arylsulfatase A-like enzyme